MSMSEIGSSLASFFSCAWSKIKSAFRISHGTKYTKVPTYTHQWIDAHGNITNEGFKQFPLNPQTDPEIELSDTEAQAETKSPFHTSINNTSH